MSNSRDLGMAVGWVGFLMGLPLLGCGAVVAILAGRTRVGALAGAFCGRRKSAVTTADFVEGAD